MQRPDVLTTLDERVRERSILQHPFYVAWEKGELTRAQLAAYARTYYPHVRAFSHYLENAIAAAGDPEVRAELERNLTDERSRPKAHEELWLDFAEALDENREDVAVSPARPCVQAMIDAFERLTSRDVASGLAALYAYESQQPEVSRRKMEGLRDLYGVQSEAGLSYFDVHATTDLKHRAGERRALDRSLAAGVAPETVLNAADQALDAYWGLLDGICEEAGVSVGSGGAVTSS